MHEIGLSPFDFAELQSAGWLQVACGQAQGQRSAAALQDEEGRVDGGCLDPEDCRGVLISPSSASTMIAWSALKGAGRRCGLDERPSRLNFEASPSTATEGRPSFIMACVESLGDDFRRCQEPVMPEVLAHPRVHFLLCRSSSSLGLMQH